MADTVWHIAMNPVRQSCGCTEWQQWSAQAGAWVRKTFTCTTHKAR